MSLISKSMPTKVYLGFTGVTKCDTAVFDTVEEAVEYVRKEIEDNNEVRKEKPDQPKLVWWMNDASHLGGTK